MRRESTRETGARRARAPLTRRDFLIRLGATGGSGLVLSAMNAWELLAAPAGPRPALSGKAPGTRVLVLGAGVSGLVVAYELERLGYDVRVLEARDRTGGVCRTVRRGDEVTETGGERQVCDFDEGLYFNPGPWRIPHNHTAILEYCKELGVALELFVDEHDAGYLYFEGEQAGPLAGRRVRMREVKADLRGHTAELLAMAVDRGRLDLPLSEEDRELLVAYLVHEGYLDQEDLAYRGIRGWGDDVAPHDLASLLRSGFGSRFRSVEPGTGNRSPWFQPVGGMDRIPQAFHGALGDRVVLGAEVVTIRQNEDEVRVAVRDTSTGEEREETADYCVVCIPLSVLKEMDAGLSSEKAEAVSSVNYAAVAKIGLQMRRRFWEEDDGIFGGRTRTDLPLGQFCYPCNDYYTEKGVLLGFYGNGRMTGADDTPLVEMSNGDRIEHVLAHAGKFHPQIREEFETGFCAFWERIPYSNGAYATGVGSLLPELEEPDGRVYLGCAAVSRAPAWFEGAVAAAWHAVESLHERVMQGDQA